MNPDKPIIITHAQQVYINCITQIVDAQVKFKEAIRLLEGLKNGKR